MPGNYKMFKIQKNTSRKKMNSQKLNKDIIKKTRKLEGNNMSKRLTIPSDFYGSGVIPSSSQKESIGKKPKDRKENHVSENFQGIFDNCLNIRRSERLLKKVSNQKLSNKKTILGGNVQVKSNNSSDDLNHSENISNGAFHGIFNKCLKLNSYEEKDILDSQKSKQFLTNNYSSKFNKPDDTKHRHSLKKSCSIFDEINELYTKSSQTKKLRTSSEEITTGSKFCTSLFQQLSNDFTLDQTTLLTCKSKIFSEIKKLEYILTGKIKMEECPPKPKVYSRETEECDSFINRECFPKSGWVYKTPPGQKIHPPRLEYNQMQPAVIYTTEKQTQLFELKQNVGGNIDNLERRNQIPVNKNLMNHLVTKNHNLEMKNVDVGPCSSKSCLGNANSQFNFPKEEENNFMKLLSRPSKCVKHPIREVKQAKRKLEETLSEETYSHDKLGQSRKTNIKSDFNFNMTTSNLEQHNYNHIHLVDSENESSFEDVDTLNNGALNFDFKTVSINGEHHSGFNFQ